MLDVCNLIAPRVRGYQSPNCAWFWTCSPEVTSPLLTRLSAKALLTGPSCRTSADLPPHHLLEAIGFQCFLPVAEKEVHYKRLLSSVGKLNFSSE